MAYELQPGEGLVPDLTPENARSLLAAAEAQGLHPSVVRTTSSGFIVPLSLLEGDDDDEDADEEKKKATAAKRAATRAANKAAAEKKGS